MCAREEAKAIKVNNPATIHGANRLIMMKIFGIIETYRRIQPKQAFK